MINKKELRGKLFKHLDGLVTAPTLVALNGTGVLAYFLEHGQANLSVLTSKFNANEGYFNVALRVLASQGMLIQEIDKNHKDVHYKLTDKGAVVFPIADVYNDVVDLIKLSGQYHPRKFERQPFEALHKLFIKYKEHFGLDLNGPDSRVHKEIIDHIEGFLVGPTLVHLGMGGMFHKYFMETSFRPDEFHSDPESFKKLLGFLVHLGWFTMKNENYQFTETGLFFAKRASAYGVTVSYLPTFRHLDDLIFGDPNVLRQSGNGSDELHVDREMNVWGSGGAHSNYFKVVDEIIIELFNRPIEEQPKGILDMGCGNGAFLQHIFSVIDHHTLRGELLDEHPLFLVGVDYNEAALKVTRRNLVQSEIWAKVIWGDIGKPDRLAKDLNENYGIDLKELLNVRTFLDHNRIWEEPEKVNAERNSDSSGAYAFRGRRISNNLVEDNLLQHMLRWAPYVEKFGLLAIELHTIDPHLVASALGKTAATAYDATHGFSDQYIVEIEVFHQVCAEAGLFSDHQVFTKFPNSELGNISVNLLRGKRES